jgi:nucleoside 2-deoxyribosyltransferase
MTNSKASKMPESDQDLHEPVKTKRHKVFVVSPIGSEGSAIREHADLVLEFVINAGLPESEWEVTRADAHENPDSITRTMMDALSESDLIVALLTGNNPNVLYELAVAHCWEKPVVCVLKNGDTVPFDVHDTRMVWYDLANPRSVQSAASTMKVYASAAIHSGPEQVSPVTHQLAKRKDSSNKNTAPKAAARQHSSPNDRIIEMLEEMNSRIAGLENRMIIGAGQRSRAYSDASVRRNDIRSLNDVKHYVTTTDGSVMTHEEFAAYDRKMDSVVQQSAKPRVIRTLSPQKREEALRDTLNRKMSSGSPLSDIEAAAMNGDPGALHYLLES